MFTYVRNLVCISLGFSGFCIQYFAFISPQMSTTAAMNNTKWNTSMYHCIYKVRAGWSNVGSVLKKKEKEKKTKGFCEKFN